MVVRLTLAWHDCDSEASTMLTGDLLRLRRRSRPTRRWGEGRRSVVVRRAEQVPLCHHFPTLAMLHHRQCTDQLIWPNVGCWSLLVSLPTPRRKSSLRPLKIRAQLGRDLERLNSKKLTTEVTMKLVPNALTL